MGKSSKQTTTQQLDPTTQYLQRLAIGSALGALGLPGGQTAQLFGKTLPIGPTIAPIGPKLQPIPGVSPLTQQAISAYQSALPAYNLGLGAAMGDQAAISTLMNPFQQNVIDQVAAQYGDLASLTTNSINDQATQAHAFGGSRQGVAQGVALGQLNKDLGSQLAGLRYQGFNDAMQRAAGLVNLGLGAAGQLDQLGEYERQVAIQQDPAMRQLTILQSLLSGNPIATSTSVPMTRSPIAGGLSGAASGAAIGSVIPGVGTALGAGIGGLLGLFQ